MKAYSYTLYSLIILSFLLSSCSSQKVAVPNANIHVFEIGPHINIDSVNAISPEIITNAKVLLGNLSKRKLVYNERQLSYFIYDEEGEIAIHYNFNSTDSTLTTNRRVEDGSYEENMTKLEFLYDQEIIEKTSEDIKKDGVLDIILDNNQKISGQTVNKIVVKQNGDYGEIFFPSNTPFPSNEVSMMFQMASFMIFQFDVYEDGKKTFSYQPLSHEISNDSRVFNLATSAVKKEDERQ